MFEQVAHFWGSTTTTNSEEKGGREQASRPAVANPTRTRVVTAAASSTSAATRLADRNHHQNLPPTLYVTTRSACALFVCYEEGRYVVAKRTPRPLNGRGCEEERDYAEILLECATDVEAVVKNAVCDEGRSTAASRRADILAASAPTKMRRLAELAARVVRYAPEALVSLLLLDARIAVVLQDVFDAADATSECCAMWLSFAPIKRGFAVSIHHPRAAQSLATKYAEKFEARFAKLEGAVESLNTLQSRLPVRQRRIRFNSEVGERVVERVVWSAATYDSDGKVKSNRNPILDQYGPDRVDDFLTDAAPLGLGVESMELFLRRQKTGAVFMTTETRLVELNSNEGAATLATTTLYSSDVTPRTIAMGQKDEVWSVAIDDRTYFYCVDDVDRGLRSLLERAGVDVDSLAKLGILFQRVQ